MAGPLVRGPSVRVSGALSRADAAATPRHNQRHAAVKRLGHERNP